MRNIPLPAEETLWKEATAWIEFPRLAVSMPRLLKKRTVESKRIVVMPGFGAGDFSTLPLRQFLSSLGHRVSGWRQGANTGDVPELIEHMTRQIQQEAEHAEEKIVLIGWSLGGYIAREVARGLPDQIEQVITLGSPVVGGPRYTRVAPLFVARGMNMDEVEAQVDALYETPLRVPVTAIYSKSDGIVAWQACIDEQSDGVEHVEVRASHIGLGISADVFEIISEQLP